MSSVRFLINRASYGLHETKPPTKDAFLVDGEWVIDFESLDALMGFIEREGQCVISTESCVPSLLIYDDWLE